MSRAKPPRKDHFRLLDPGLFQAGKQLDGKVFPHLPKLGLHGTQRLGLLLPRQFVGLRQKDMNWASRRPEPVEHAQIEFGHRAARVHDDHQPGQGATALQIGANQAFPLGAHRLRRLGVPIARQVHEIFALVQGKVIQVLRSPRSMAEMSCSASVRLSRACSSKTVIFRSSPAE